MARGWDSKSVEEQIQSAHKREGKVGAKRELTPAEADIERKRDSILLQRTRVMRDLEGCTSDRYRKTLETGLAFLDSQLASLPKH